MCVRVCEGFVAKMIIKEFMTRPNVKIAYSWFRFRIIVEF